MVAPKKPGPHPENPKDTMIRVRVDKIILKELDESAKALDTSRSDVIRKGIHQVYSDLKK
ncbi:MAG: ribbon-helix-helix protein, CopG family [Candidatus Fimivicinus sp.]|nr:ribbon-helix-helix protein, CopG family [Candidatus Fimivicinus sp.]